MAIYPVAFKEGKSTALGCVFKFLGGKFKRNIVSMVQGLTWIVI